MEIENEPETKRYQQNHPKNSRQQTNLVKTISDHTVMLCGKKIKWKTTEHEAREKNPKNSTFGGLTSNNVSKI